MNIAKVIQTARLLGSRAHASQILPMARGFSAGERMPFTNAPDAATALPNPLRESVRSPHQKRCVLKWDHYLDMYHRHLAQFRGTEVHFLEIGVFGGGSLEMWKEYFGPRCRVYGVDIEPSCRQFESDGTRIFIGDQSDREFWKSVRSAVPRIDVAVDDGGHQFEQQVVTLEEILPYMPGGSVYICEDIHGAFNHFASYVFGMAHSLNSCIRMERDDRDPDRQITSAAANVQRAVSSIHLYPFATVIERTHAELRELVSPRCGAPLPEFASRA